MSPAHAEDLPTGASVSAGQVAIAQTASTLNINQTSDKAIINWQTFDIASGASVNYTLPSSKSFTLNRVIGDNPTKILGSLTSNGQIYLLNPRGILFGAGSRVNAAGLVASTMSMKDEDFLAGRYVFTDNGSKAAVVNEGEIVVNGGYAALLSSNVRNEGIVSSRLGTVALAAGQKLTLDVSGDQLVSVQVEPALVGQLIENRGMIAAEDGRVIMTLSSERRLIDSAIASRVEQAKAIVAAGDGTVSRIAAAGEITAAQVDIEAGSVGTADVAGALTTASDISGGGKISVTGGDVVLRATSRLDATGASGGGQISVGGGYQGRDDNLLNARTTTVESGATIAADAGTAGDGGRIVVWSDQLTRFDGKISATGGRTGGNGGFAEVSGKSRLDFTGAVDLNASAGDSGTLLLDPYNLTIQSSGTDTNVTGTDASGTGSILTVSSLQNALNSANVVVTTGTSGSEAGNITVASDLSWLSSNNLTLRAANDIVINANILALSGGLTLQAGLSADGTTASAAGSISLNAANSIRLLTRGLTATAVTGIALSGYVESKTLTSLTSTTGNVSASSTSNVFSAGIAATSGSTGSVTIKGTGNTELKAISAGTGGATIEIAGSITSTSSFTSLGAASITTPLGSDGNIDLTGAFSVSGNVSLSADKPGFIRINNIAGDTTFDTIVAGGAITLASASNVLTLGVSGTSITGLAGDAGQASGLVSITAAAVTIAKSIVTAGGNVSITSTSGAVTASAGANITTTAAINTGTTSGSVAVAGASGVSLNNITTTGAANNLAAGSNAATVNISSTSGDVSVYAITTSGGQPMRADGTGSGLDNGGNAASITLSAGTGRKTVLRGNLTAVGGIFSGTSAAAQGLGGNILTLGAVTLADHVTLDTGATTGYVYLLGTVDSDSASALKSLTIVAGAGNVRFGGAVGQTAALYSVDVNSAVTTDIFASLKTDGSTTIAGRTTGVRISTSSKLNFGNVSTESDNSTVVIDTSGGNGVFTLNNGQTIASELHAPVVFNRGTSAIYLSSTLSSTSGEYNNLTFTTPTGSGGGAVTVTSTVGGGTQGSLTALGDISLSSVSTLSFQAGISAKSLVSLGGTGSMTLATNGGVGQYYSGVNGLQLSSSSASALSVNLNATLTAAGAPVSLSMTGANAGLTISGTTTTNAGAVTISTRGLLTASTNNSSISTTNGAITLTGLGGIDNQSNSSTSNYNAGSGKIRMFGGGNTITMYALLSTTNADTGGTPAVLITDAGTVNISTVNANAANLGVGTFQVGIVGSTTAIAPAQSVGAGGSLTLLSAGLRLRTSQALTLTFTGNESTNSFVITGTDASGNAQTETVSGASATSVTSTKSFKTITSVVATNATAANVSVGLASSDTISGALVQQDVFNQTDKIDIANLTVSSASSISITSSVNKIDTLANFDVGSSLTVKAVGHTAGMALTGNVTATSVDIATGNGALILGNYNITATSGNATLTGFGVTQGASSTITASNQVYVYGYDYNNGNNRGIVNFLGNIVAGSTAANAVNIQGFSNAVLGNITAGTSANRGGLQMGDDSYYNISGSGNYYWNWFTGSITQNANTAIKVGQFTARAHDSGSGAIALINAGNEFKTLSRVVRRGAFSLYDADTEANGLQIVGHLSEGNNANAIAIQTRGAFTTAGGYQIYGNGVVLDAASINDGGANIYSGSGDLVLRANGGNVTLSGQQWSASGTNNYLIQNSNNIQLAYTHDFAKLQFGFTAVPTSVAASQAITGSGGALTINGSAATSGTASSTSGNRIVVVSTGDDSSRSFTVTGTDMFGRTQTETITGANAGSASGSKYFSTVTSVAAGTAAASSSVTVGWATESVAGNVTQQNDVDLTALSGKVGGSITLSRTNNSFSSVTDLTAVGAIALQTDNNLTISGALVSTTGAVSVSNYYTHTISSTGSVTAAGNVSLLSTQGLLSISGAVTSNTGGITLQTNNGSGTISLAAAGSLNTLGTAQAITVNAYRDVTIAGTIASTGNVSISTAYVNGALGAFSNTGAITTTGTSSTIVVTTYPGYSLTVGGAITSAGALQLLAGGTFTSTAAGVISSGASGSVAIRSGYQFGTANTYSVNIAGNIVAGSGGVQFYSNDKVTQTTGTITSTGNLVGINANGGTPVYASPSSQGTVTLNGNNSVAGIGPFYVKGENGDSDFIFNNTGGGLRISGDISTSNGSITIRTVGGLLDLQSFNIKAGEYLTNGGGNITLTGRGINQSLGTINANGSTSGTVAGDGTAGGSIVLTGHDGTDFGNITLNGTLRTLNNTANAITIRGTGNLVLPSISAINGTLILGDDTATIGLISGNISQAAGTTVAAKTLTLGTATNAIGGSAVLINSGNKFDSLGIIKVGDAAGTQYDLDIADSTAGLTLGAAVTSAGGMRITTVKTVADASGVLAIGANSLTASGDVYLAGNTVTQSTASTINAGSGAITVNGGGGADSYSITLSGTLTTTNATSSAIQILAAANTTLNALVARSGGVVLGTSANPLTGTVSQTPTTGIIEAATLSGNLGVLTATNTKIDNLGTLTTTGALTLKDIGGTGTGGLAVTGTVTAGAASSIETTDGSFRIGAQTINVAGFNLSLKGVGISQTTGSAVFATTSTVNAGTGSIDLVSALNDFTGQVTLMSTGAFANIADANQLSLNSLTGKLATTTSISAVAGTQLVLTPEDLTTTSGNIYLQSKNGDLSTPGNLTSTTGNITLIANFGVATTGDTQVNNTIQTTSGNVTIFADREVNLAKSILSTSGNISVTGDTVTHSTGSSTDILYLRTGSAGNVSVTAAQTGGLTMGPFYYYQADTGTISITAGGTIRLSNITSNGRLSVTGVGLIQQYDGARIAATELSVTARDNATAGSGIITLANLANNAGAIRLVTRNAADTAAGAGAISYYDADAFSVARIQSAGSVTLTAGGVISTAAAGTLGTGQVEANLLTVKTLNNAGAGVLLTAADNNIGTLNVSIRNAADTARAGSTTGEDTATGVGGTVRYSDSNGFTISGISTGASAVLGSGGAVTQSGAIVAEKLGLQGAGNFTLNLADASSNPVNTVSVFASEATGSLVFSSLTALTIGSVNPVGITSGGAAVNIRAPSIDSSSSTIDTRSSVPGASGGSVTLTTTGTGANGALITGVINTSGADAASGDSNGGNAGAVTLTASGSVLSVGGTITARGGAKSGTGNNGADGTVRLLATAGAVSQNTISNTPNEISAGQLIIDALNTSVLESNDNRADKVVARISGDGQSLTYRSSNTFAVGGGTAAGLTWNGITTQGGAVTIGSLGAAITVNEAITTRGGTLVVGISAAPVTSFNSSGVTVSTAGDITIGSTTAYSSGGRISVVASGDITTGAMTSSGDTAAASASAGVISLTSTGGTISSGALTANGRDAAGGAVTLTAANINLIGNISTTANTTNAATSGGNITLDGAVSLGGDRTLTTGAASGGNITFLGTVDAPVSAYNLTLTAGKGDITFTGAVGATAALGAVNIASATNVSVLSSFAAGSFTQQAGTNLTTISGPMTLANGFSFTGKDLTLSGTLTTGSSVSIANSGVFTTTTGADTSAAGAFSQTGAGENQLAGNISTSNANITLSQKVTLNGAISLASAGGSINFLSTVDSAASGAKALSLDAGTGNVTFSDKLGFTQKLGDISVTSGGTTKFSTTVDATGVSTDAAGNTQINAAITTTGVQLYRDTLNLAASVTLTAATLKTQGIVSGGDKSLTVVGDAEFGNPSGTNDSVTGLATLSVSGTTLIETAILTSSGTQSYSGDLTLGTDTTLSTTNSTVTFGGAVNSAAAETNSLSIVAGSAAVTFNGNIGDANRVGDLNIGSAGETAFKGTVAARSLTTNVGGTTKITGSIDTTEDQVFNDAVVLAGDVTLSARDITLNLTTKSDSAQTARALTLTGSRTTTIGDTIGATAALSSLTVNGGGTTLLNGASVTTSGGQTYDDVLVLGHDITLTGTSIALNGTVDSDDVATPRAMTVTGTGAKTFNGTLGFTAAIGALTVNGGGTTVLHGGLIKTNGVQTYTDAVTLGVATQLASSGNNISFASTLRSDTTPFSLEITAGAGDVTFTGAVGTQTVGLGAIKVNSADDISFASTLQAASYEQLAGTGLTKLDAASTLGDYFKFTGSALTLNAAMTATGEIVVTNAAAFTTAAAGDITAAKLTQSGVGTNKLGGEITTSGDIAFASAVELTGPVVATASASTSTISFASTINSSTTDARNLTLSAGQDILLSGALGGTNKLGALALSAAGVTRLSGAVTATSVTSDAAGSIELFANVTTTGGTQSYADELHLKANVTLAGTTISVGKVVGETNALTITGNAQLGATGGSDTLAGLTTLSISGTSTLNAASVTSSGAQTFTGAVTLARAVSLVGAGISFVSTIDGAKALSITDTGATTFGAAVGGTTVLTSLSVDGGGTTKINGGAISTSGDQTYSNAVELGAATSLTGSTVSFLNALTGGSGASAYGLTVVGNAVLGDATGYGSENISLGSLSITGNTTLNVQSVTTTGAQLFDGNVLFSADSSLTTSNANFTVTGTWTGAGNVAVHTGSGNILLQGAIGDAVTAYAGTLTLDATGTKTLQSTVDAGSLTTLGASTVYLAGNVTTTDVQSYASDIVLTSGVTLTSRDISIQGSVDSGGSATAKSLTVVATGDFALSGSLGGTRRLLDLAINATNGISLSGAITTDGSQTFTGSLKLVGDTTLSGTDITVNSAINGDASQTARALTLTGTGTKTFKGTIGATKAIGALTLNGGGATVLQGGAINTMGAQTYSDAASLGANTLLSSSGSNISFASTLGSVTTPFSLEITAGLGDVTFTGAVGTQTVGLGAIKINSARDISFASTLQAASYEQLAGTGLTKLDAASTLGDYFKFTGSALTLNAAMTATGDVVVANTGAFTTAAAGDMTAARLSQTGTGANSLSGDIATSGTISFASALDLTGGISLSGTTVSILDAVTGNSHALAISGAAVLGSGDVGDTYTGLTTFSVTGATTLSTALISTSSSQSFGGAITLGANAELRGTGVTLGGNVDGAFALTVTNSGITTLNGAVGGTTLLTSFTVQGGGTLDVQNGSVKTSASQSYGTLSVGTNATFIAPTVSTGSISGSGSLSIVGNAVLGTGAASETIQGLASLSVTSGATTFNVASIQTAGAQSYAGAATLLQATTLTTTNAAVTFGGAVDGAFALDVSVGSGNVTFTGAVGATTRLGGVHLASTGLMTFASTVRAASVSTNTNSTVYLGGNVDTTGIQTYNDAIILTNDVILTGTDVTLNQAVDSDGTARALTVRGSGVTTFGAAVGSTAPLASLTVNNGGKTVIAGSTVSTVGRQIYGDAIELAANTTLTSFDPAFTGSSDPFVSSVDFFSTLDSVASTPATLTISAGNKDVNFYQVVGGAGSGLGAVTITSARDFAIGRAFTAASVSVSNSRVGQLYGPITVAGAFTQTGSGVNYLQSSITAGTNVTLSANAILEANAAIYATGGTIDLAAVDGTAGTESLLVKSSGAFVIDAAIGASTSIGTLWIEAAGVSQGVRIDTNNSIISGSGFAIKASKLAVTSSGLVDLIHPNNVVPTVAAALSNNADYRFTNYNNAGVTIGTIVNPFDAAVSVVGLKASGASNTSDASFVVGGLLSQTANAVIRLGGNLTINAQPNTRRDVAFNNTGTGALGTALGNTLVAGNFDLQSVGNATQVPGINTIIDNANATPPTSHIEDAYLQVGGNFNLTGGGTLVQGNSSLNVFGFGAGTAQANTISLNGVITLSVSGDKLVGTSNFATFDPNNNNSCLTGCVAVDLTTGGTPNEITVISQAGGKSILSGGSTVGTAVQLTEVNDVRGALSITTAGAYTDLGTAVETGIKTDGAISLVNNLILTVQQSTANATSTVAGKGALNLGAANALGGTISANAFGMPVTLKNTQDLSLGTVQGTTVTLTTTSGGITQATGGVIVADQLVVTAAADVLLTKTNTVSALTAAVAGKFSLVNGRSLIIGDGSTGVTTTGSGDVTIETKVGNIALANVISSSGNVTLATAGTFSNTAGASALTVGTGKVWRIWSQDPANDTLGGLAPEFKQYAATYGTTTVLGGSSKNGVLYTLAPTLTVSLSGHISKVYDGTTNVSLTSNDLVSYGVSGAVGTDVVTVSATGFAFDTKDVLRDTNNVVLGTKTISASGVTFTAVDSTAQDAIPVYGYQLSATPVTGDIGRITTKTLTLTGLDSALTKVYDGAVTAIIASGATPALKATVTTAAGLSTDGKPIDGDVVSILGTPSGTFDSANVLNASTVTFSGLTLDGADAGNYLLNLSYAGSITPYVVSLTGSRVYDATTDVAASTLTIGALVGSETL
ncbi:MAG: filamentous hemagglutinin N-terminal domain-containing protein, partial [Chakrabartia godavariana]